MPLYCRRKVFAATIVTDSGLFRCYVMCVIYMSVTCTDACGEDSDCEQLCFPSANGHTCACAIGFTLNKDGKSCDSGKTHRYTNSLVRRRRCRPLRIEDIHPLFPC